VVRLLPHCFETIKVDIDKFMGFEKYFNTWPVAGYMGMEVFEAQVAKTQVHHFRRWISQQYSGQF
jgi:hypothetical protein